MARRWLRRGREAPAPPPVPPAVRIVPAPASAADGYYSGLAVSNGTWRAGRGVPPPLHAIGPDAMLAVAPCAARSRGSGARRRRACSWAWPHAAGAIHAEEMTAAQLRAILAARDHG
jgi:hypothetical protein